MARIPLRTGRHFTAADDDRSPKVAIINDSFARRYFPAEDPLAQRVIIYGVERQVIDVAGNEKFLGLGRETPPAAYVPFRQNPLNALTLLVRGAPSGPGDPLALAPAVQKQIWALDPELAPFDVMSLEQGLAVTLAQRRFLMMLLAVFAAVALVLAAVGLYGVLAHWVSRRTNEIGLRMAVGAGRGEVLRMVLAQGLRLSALGVPVGAAASLWLARFLTAQLFGISAADPATFAALPLLLLAVALAACWFPARRATRVDPMTALPYE